LLTAIFPQAEKWLIIHSLLAMRVNLPMRLEVFCEDRLGLTRELLDLLVLRGIDLRGIDIDPIGRIYLNFAELEFDNFRTLMAEIRRIAGVTDVRTVPWMPSEREHLALSALLEAMPEPVLSLDTKSKVELANPASCQLFGQSQDKLRNHNAAQLINGFNFQRWLEGSPVESHAEHVVINGQNFLLEITPVTLEGENATRVLMGAVVMLRSTLRMGRQLQNMTTQDVSAFSQIIAASPKMRHVVEQARKLALLSAPLLIVGDTGTGKDLLANACHLASPRAQKPYLALNCASIPEDAVESELFGHAPEGKKGFFEQANGGSVLLDEIGEMSPGMQVKLLRFLNDGTFRRVGEDHEIHVDVRVICATQKNLVELVQKGLFREDLYYRLNVLTLNLPPLRDRPQDIMPLTELFVARFADEQGIARPKLAADLNTVLTRYGWPGNVRQLKNAVYRALTQLDGYELRPQDILLPDYDTTTVAVGEDAMEGSLDDITSRFERSVLTQLYRSYPSTRKLAKRLGVSHTAIANKLREYGLSQKKSEE
jgi:transcriptional regulator of aroF, aroG, tyrA and aromatic amino acid transport